MIDTLESLALNDEVKLKMTNKNDWLIFVTYAMLKSENALISMEAEWAIRIHLNQFELDIVWNSRILQFMFFFY